MDKLDSTETVLVKVKSWLCCKCHEPTLGLNGRDKKVGDKCENCGRLITEIVDEKDARWKNSSLQILNDPPEGLSGLYPLCTQK